MPFCGRSGSLALLRPSMLRMTVQTREFGVFGLSDSTNFLQVACFSSAKIRPASILALRASAVRCGSPGYRLSAA